MSIVIPPIVVDVLKGAFAGGVYSVTTAIRKRDDQGNRAEFDNRKFIRTFLIGAVLGLISYQTGLSMDSVAQNVVFLSGATAVVENLMLLIERELKLRK